MDKDKELEESSSQKSEDTSYDPEDYISGPRCSPNSTIPINILEFENSFGYDNKKLFNLCLIHPDVLVFGSGNYIHFFQISKNEMVFKRTACGGGIGCIIKNPNPEYNYLTVAENGINPPVIIYNYPQLEIIKVLKNGAQKSFTRLDYNSDGTLLATQAGEPDYMLTIWDWQNNSIILRARSFQNDVLNVKFSPYNPSDLTTCGLGHIKFWKMCSTFTGLKLKGELGRFGKTEICDIYGIYPLQDEKVISGCEWGNMLLWEGGLIKLEVCRKNRMPCHTAPITQISMDEGEVTTVGMDGYVRVWFWETVEIADPPDDDRFVEIEPIYEFKIGTKNHSCELRCLIKHKPLQKNNYRYFAQDGSGGIWSCDLNFERTPEQSKQLFSCHEGRIVAIGSSSVSSHIATVGEGGRLNIYNYKNKKLLCQKQFPANAVDLIWLPHSIDPSGLVIVLGFDDGVIRMVLVEIEERKSIHERVHLLEAIKSHSTGITKLSINEKQTVLVSGSKEKRIFIHQIAFSSPFIELKPIGFIDVPSIPIAFNWKFNKNATIIVGCLNGEIIETDVPERVRSYTQNSYNLNHIQLKIFNFKSIKSEIQRQERRDKIKKKKAEKLAKKMELAEELKASNPEMEMEEEIDLDSDPEDENEILFVPKIPNYVLWLQSMPTQTVWISMSGYDAGYIYELMFGNPSEIVQSTLIKDASDIEIHSYFYHYNYLIFGMQNGAVRINSRKENYRDLSDYWELTMHDNNNGIISGICSSYDDRYLFTIGHDGNIFQYRWNCKFPYKQVSVGSRYTVPGKIHDIEDRDYLSLEEQKIKNENDRYLAIASEKKEKVLDILSDYKVQFKDLMKRNRLLPLSQQITQDEIEWDPRITKHLIHSLEEDIRLLRRKIAFDVEKASLANKKVMDYFLKPLENLSVEIAGIRNGLIVKSSRLQKLDEEFTNIKEEIENRIQKENERKRIMQVIDDMTNDDLKPILQIQESFLQGLSASTIEIKLGTKMKRLLDKYRLRKLQEKQRIQEWDIVNSQEPDPNKNHIDDIRQIEEAQKSIGDYKLKIDPEYETDGNETTLQKYKELLQVREEIYKIRHDYNGKVFELRKKKRDLYKFIDEKQKKLNSIHEQLPEVLRKYIEKLPEIDVAKENPEIKLKLSVQSEDDIQAEDLLFQKSDSSIFQTKRSREDLYNRLEWQTIGMGPSAETLPFEEICELLTKVPNMSSHSLIDLQNLTSSKTTSPIEMELRYRKILEGTSIQAEILYETEKSLKDFDDDLKILSEQKLQVETDLKFLENYLITLNQELWILRDFERLEENLIDEVENTLMERNEIQTKIIRIRTKVEDIKKSIETSIEQKKSIEQEFISNIKGNKFADYLNKIFKKKYKQPKVTTNEDSDESSESEESSTSEDESDNKSISSLELGPMKIDESYCPPGCDKTFYDLTFTLRTQRHHVEQKVHDDHKHIDESRKEIDSLSMKVKSIEQTLNVHKNKLTEFRREKQKVLNTVETLIVLKMNQLHYLNDGDDINNISNALLFKANNVSQLYTRVGQIALETLEAKRKHKVNIIHLTRMKSDCKFMQKEILRLKDEINEAMIKKFGIIINSDELEESVLRRLVFNIKTNLEDERKEAERETIAKQEILANAKIEFIKETQIETEKLNILTVLQEEKNFLTEVLTYQKKLYEKRKNAKHIDLRHDLNKLSNIDRQQKQQMEYLEKEIRTLRLKSKPFVNIGQDAELPGPSGGLSGGELFEILPPQTEHDYEESIYMNVRQTTPIIRATSTDAKTDEKISNIVRKFLIKHVGKQMNESITLKYTQKITKYLSYVAQNFDTNQSEKIMKCVIENFQNMIPQKYLILIKPKDIANLFREIVTVFHEKEETEIDINELIDGVIANALEISSHLSLLNFTQDVFSEILRELIEVLTIDDIENKKNMELIAKKLINISQFNEKCINVDQTCDDVLQHAKENVLEEINLHTLKNFLEMLISKLKDARLSFTASKVTSQKSEDNWN